MNKPLPQGITRAVFDAAAGELLEALGADRVYLDDQTQLTTYSDAYDTIDGSTRLPSAAVAAENVEEIQKVLAVARKYKLPLWTISTGKNFAYGGAAPGKAGYIMLDLKRMNRIIEVNEKYGYAVVEPGVSYFDLYNHLQRIGSKLWIDAAAPGWGGVIGNMLEHGVGYTPYGDHLLMQCGMQVVLADGTVVDTGMDALPNARAGRLHKYGSGPWVDGMFTQSNFGVVTKVGTWLMHEPPGYRPYMVTFQNDDDLDPITEAVRPLKINMVIPNAASTVGLLWEAGVLTTKRHYYTGKGAIPESARRKIAADHDIGMWNFYGALYGPEPLMDNNWKMIADSFSAIPGAKFYFEGDRPNDPAWRYRADLMRGIPSITEFSIMNWVGSGAHIDFSPMSPVSGPDALKQFHMIRDRAAEYDFDYVGEFVVGWREMHHIFALVFDSYDEVERRRAHELFGVLIDDATAHGYGEYRTHLNFMDTIANTYN